MTRQIAQAAGRIIRFALAVAWHLVRRDVSMVRVMGVSMAPTFADRSYVLLRRHALVKTGDVVVFTNPFPAASPRLLMKRVTRLVRSPTGISLFVDGDNPDSMNSTRLGLIPLDSVLGVALETASRR